MLSAQRLLAVSCLAASVFVAQAAEAITINTFQFVGDIDVSPGGVGTPATINFLGDFDLRSQNGSNSGELVGLTGTIAGDYQFDDPAGATSVLLTSPTAPNAFTIFDGTETFVANIGLIELEGGFGGSILGTINFASSTYAGTNAGLIALDNLIQNSPNLTITFQTLGGSGVNLDELFQNGSEGVATYSAAVRVSQPPVSVPEPTPLALLGFGLLCSVAYARRRQAGSTSAS
ncbi:MAG: PEP-CTERM sorting domain-containing protein [Alphaproteobacteria bacterium]